MSFDTPTPLFSASDPTATYLNISCLDLLLIEMVPLAERMARRAERLANGTAPGTVSDPSNGISNEEGGGGVENAPPVTAGAGGVGSVGGGVERGRGGPRGLGLQDRGSESGGGGGGGQSTAGGEGEGEDVRDAVCARLDAWGYRVGQGLSERYA